MTNIHPTAVVHRDAQLSSNVDIGPYCIIEGDVQINEGCSLQSHAYIASGTRLGENVQLANGAVVGTAPQDLKYGGEKTYLEIGDGTVIREFATVNRGTVRNKKTIVGKNCYLMAYSHVAHDCVLGDHVILSNAVNMAGHVTIQDHAIIGGMSAVHQFVTIGQYCFVGGGLRITKDVPPYVLAMGDPLRFGGVNRIGLTRKGFDNAVIAEIRRAYQILYRSSLLKQEAIAKIRQDFILRPEIEAIICFLETHKERGIIKGPALTKKDH